MFTDSEQRAQRGADAQAHARARAHIPLTKMTQISHIFLRHFIFSLQDRTQGC